MVAPGRRVIGWASQLVPSPRRRAWRREWEAEVAYAWQAMTQGAAPSAAARLKLRARILACLIDALWERKQTMTMTGFLDDVRLAVRGLRRSPGFAVVAVVTLALGIGASTAVFTLVDGVLLKALPYPAPERLVSIQHLGRGGADQLPVSDGLYLLYRDQASSLETLALHRPTVVNLIGDGDPERIRGQSVTPSFFEVLAVDAVWGRSLTEEDGIRDAEPVVVLSHGLWQSLFGGDPDAVGRILDLSGVNRRIVGIMPAGFEYPDNNVRLYLPMVIDESRASLAAFSASGIARLSATSSVLSSTTELQGLIGRLAELYPDSRAPAFLEEVGLSAQIRPLKETIVGDVSLTLWTLLGMVGFVLLIACANVANLLLVRAEVRQREVALRVAMGASRMQVLRTFMSESFVLCGVGGTLGMAVAAVAVRVSTSFAPADIPRIAEVGVDLRVLAFTATVSLGAAVIFGLLPVLRYGASDLAGQLRDGGAQSVTDGRGRRLMRSGLVIAQVALALILLAGSGLMFRSFVALRSVDPGFDTEGVMTVRLSVPAAEIPGTAETADFFRQVRERLEAQSSVISVGLVAGVPLGGQQSFIGGRLEDYPEGSGERPFWSQNSASPGFFRALGVPLLQGRTFDEDDRADGTRAAVVSEAFARRWWPDEDALGRRLSGGPSDWYEIVGVVGDARYEGLAVAAEEMVYLPTVVDGRGGPQAVRQLDLVVRVQGEATAILPVIRREVLALNARIPISTPRTMAEVVRRATSRTSFTMAVLGVASGVALILGIVGIYGVVSYVVSQRTREIGVRMALGASASEVQSMVLRQGVGLSAAGIIVGLVGAVLMSSFLASLLFGVRPVDPLTYGAVATTLALASVLATWLPARRAASVDPVRALRQE